MKYTLRMRMTGEKFKGYLPTIIEKNCEINIMAEIPIIVKSWKNDFYKSFKFEAVLLDQDKWIADVDSDGTVISIPREHALNDIMKFKVDTEQAPIEGVAEALEDLKPTTGLCSSKLIKGEVAEMFARDFIESHHETIRKLLEKEIQNGKI